MSPAQFIAWREAFGGRRFLLTLGAGVVNTALLVRGYIDQDTFFNLVTWTVGPYIAAGTVQKVMPSAPRTPNNSVPGPGADPSAGGDRV